MKIIVYISILLSISRAQVIDIVRKGAVSDRDSYDLLQSVINNNPGTEILIPANHNILIKQPLLIPSNTKLRIDGTLKLTPGVVRSITKDANIGDSIIYVDNFDGSYKIGQYISICNDSMPFGGGGAIHRQMAETSQIVAAYSNRIEIQDPLINTVQTSTVGNFTIAKNSKIGHTQSVLHMENVRDITINGIGIIDGSYPTQYNVHPNSNDPTYKFYKYEQEMGGNGISIHNSNSITIQGITLKETNIAGLTLATVDTFVLKDLLIYNTFMKHIAFTVAAHGTVENITMNGSYDEDGLSLHDNVTYTSFKNIAIKKCPRIGMGVGSGSCWNTFENIMIDSCNLSFYTNPGATSFAPHDNYFKNVIISNGAAGLMLAKCYNTRFDSLVVKFNSNSNHCITIGGECHDIIFNKGGSYDTKLLNRNGYGYRTVKKKPWHIYESYNIKFNHFNFIKLKKGLSDTGNFPTTFNQCIFSDNADNGDMTSPHFIINN